MLFEGGEGMSLRHLVVRIREVCATTPRPLIDQTRQRLEGRGQIAPEIVVMLENEASLRGLSVDRYLELLQKAVDKQDLGQQLSPKEKKLLESFEYVVKVVGMRL